jgi:hypothetical protein
MRTKLICPDCAASAGGVGTFFVQTIRDDGLYTGKCPNSHDLLIATQTLRHEMLFEIALHAINDGYYREAVSSFTASLERYFEFAIRVLSSNRGVQPAHFDKAWKAVASQSERQVGGYILLYLAEYGAGPLLLAEKTVGFRNRVTHKGYLPRKDETVAFGKEVYKIIQEGIRKLRDTKLNDVNKILSQHVEQISEGMGTRYPRTFQVTPTALNIIEDISTGYKTFEQILELYKI